MNATLKFVLTVIVCTIVTEAQAMRWYSPSTGRWLSRDTIEESGGLNLYAFTQNSPVNEIDAFGERILSLEIRHSGTAEISDSTYLSRVNTWDDYYDVILPGDLGFKHQLVPEHYVYTANSGWGSFQQVKVTRPARTAVGYKFEYVVNRECVAMDTMDKFKISQTITDFSWYKRKKGGVWMLNEQLAWKAPGTVDGPSQVEKITNLKIVAGDMIRDLVDEGDKWEYRLSVAWAVRAEDADNAFEGKHRITLIYSESGGTGKGSILQKPIEVFK